MPTTATSPGASTPGTATPGASTASHHTGANTGAAQPTVGQRVRSSPAVRQAIQTIVAEAKAAQSTITGIRGPLSEANRVSYDDMLAQAADVRGRALLYPYLGSGFGNGPYVELADGSVKLDMICGIGVQFFGHGDPDLMAVALESSTSDVVMQGHLQCNAEAYTFSDALLAEAKRGSRLRHVFLANSGVMANENALKICFQKHAPASRVLAFSHNFMGRTVTMSQIGDSPANREGVPLSTLVDYMPFYDHGAALGMSAGDASGPTRHIDAAIRRLREVVERYPKQHACFIFELVQGEGGFNTAPPEFHRELMRVCRDSGIAVWDDEVQTFGRTTEMFAYDTMGLGEFIDVCAVGKLTQTCAVLFTPEYNPRAGLLSATFLGTSQSIAVGERIVRRLREGGHFGPGGKHQRHFELFAKHAKALMARHPEWFPPVEGAHDLVDGVGGMMRFTPFGGAKDAITRLCKALFDEGLVVFYCGHGPYHIRMLPPLGVMDESLWPTVFELIEKGMTKASSGAK